MSAPFRKTFNLPPQGGKTGSINASTLVDLPTEIAIGDFNLASYLKSSELTLTAVAFELAASIFYTGEPGLQMPIQAAFLAIDGYLCATLDTTAVFANFIEEENTYMGWRGGANLPSPIRLQSIDNTQLLIETIVPKNTSALAYNLIGQGDPLAGRTGPIPYTSLTLIGEISPGGS